MCTLCAEIGTTDSMRKTMLMPNEHLGFQKLCFPLGNFQFPHLNQMQHELDYEAYGGYCDRAIQYTVWPRCFWLIVAIAGDRSKRWTGLH